MVHIPERCTKIRGVALDPSQGNCYYKTMVYTCVINQRVSSCGFGFMGSFMRHKMSRGSRHRYKCVYVVCGHKHVTLSIPSITEQTAEICHLLKQRTINCYIDGYKTLALSALMNLDLYGFCFSR